MIDGDDQIQCDCTQDGERNVPRIYDEKGCEHDGAVSPHLEFSGADAMTFLKVDGQNTKAAETRFVTDQDQQTYPGQ